MTERTKKIVLPAYLIRRCEAFRIVKGDATSYIVRDKLHGKTHDFDSWQFFILEVLPGCESLEKLQSVFHDRFDRTITKPELEAFFASIADRKLFDETALQHPLLSQFAKRTYEVVEGKAVPRQHSASVAIVGGTAVTSPEAAPSAEPGAKAGTDDAQGDLPAGVQDVVGLDPRAGRRIIDLFDPRPILRVLTPVLSPLRYLAYALPLLLVVSLIVATQHWRLLLDDLQALQVETSLFEHLVFALLTVNLLSTISSACVAHSFRASVERIGLTLYVGFIPRFIPRIKGVDRLGRRERMWLHGSNLILRALLLCGGMLLWYNTRNMAGVLHEVGLAFVLTCWGSLVLETGNPLVRGSAYFLLSAYLNQPHLRGKAYKALMNKLRAGVYRSADSNVLALYALASITYVVLLVLVLMLGLNQWLMRELKLGGVALFITMAVAAFLLWRNYVGLRKFGDTYERTVQFDRWRTRTLLTEGQSEGEVPVRRPSYWRRALLVCLLLVLFIPYPYDASGSFSIYPVRKQVMSTDTPGLIEEVFFEGGEAVKKGTVLARLAHEDYTAQIKVLDAKMAEQKAIVDDLKARPKPEEVKLAQDALEVARTREQFSREKVPRLEKLYKVGVVTFEEFDAARKDHDTDVAQVAEKRAALNLVKSGVTAEQIAAAQAKLVSLVEERATYVAKVDRMTLRMPFEGNILTLHLKDRTNSYLDRGQPFATVEYTGVVTAEVEITESDLQYVSIGSTVRARPYSYYNREFDGKVTLIDRNVTSKPVGSVVKVIATFENPDQALRTGMTGQAKIDGKTMPLWEAFSQALVRFVKVQVWSWIP